MRTALALLLLAGALRAAVWTDLGGGIAGQAGVPLLVGQGPLTPASQGAIELSGTPPFAPALLFLSFVQVAVPFKGGLLEAFPPIGQFLMTTGPAGVTLAWDSWPPSLPPGLDMYFQVVAVLDGAAVKGVALTNLLLGTTQP